MKAVGIEIAKAHDLGHRLMRGAGSDALVQPRQFASCQIAIQAPQPPWIHPQDSGKNPVGIARGTLDAEDLQRDIARAVASADLKEGTAAWAEKRPPRFTGR